MTFSILRVASPSRSAAASAGSGAGHRGGCDLVAALRGILAGAQNRRDDLIERGADGCVAVDWGSNLFWSAVTPSASPPLTNTMRTVVGAIETPSTTSTSPNAGKLRV